jgi:hypothetical protein
LPFYLLFSAMFVDSPAQADARREMGPNAALPIGFSAN